MKKDILYLHWLRALAIILVVILHCRMLEVPGFIGLCWNVMNVLTITCVPLFVMISGALLLSRGEDLMAFYRKRMPKLLVPMVAWGGIFRVAVPIEWRGYK